MGWYSAQLNIRGRRSAHNSLQDKLDIAKWEWLEKEVQRLINDPEYASLELTVELNID